MSRTDPAAGPARVLLWRGGDDLEVLPVPVPEPGPGRTLVRVRAAAVCGSDLHTVAGRRPAPCPGVLGHEGVGEVVAAGSGSPHRRGARVVWSVISACGDCDRCRRGLAAKCRSLRKAGHEPWSGPWPMSGSFATHVLLPAGHRAVLVPEHVPDAVAATAACAGATVMAALEAGGGADLADRRVLVLGAGMLGVLAVCAARARGARDVLVVDPSPARRDLARAAGAAAVAASPPSAPRVDLALELSGAPAAVRSAIDALDIGGTAVLAGSVHPGPEVGLDPESLVRGWRTVTGVHNYAPHHLDEAMALLASPAGLALPWERIAGAPIPLADAPAALIAGPGPHLRTIIAP